MNNLIISLRPLLVLLTVLLVAGVDGIFLDGVAIHSARAENNPGMSEIASFLRPSVPSGDDAAAGIPAQNTFPAVRRAGAEEIRRAGLRTDGLTVVESGFGLRRGDLIAFIDDKAVSTQTVFRKTLCNAGDRKIPVLLYRDNLPRRIEIEVPRGHHSICAADPGAIQPPHPPSSTFGAERDGTVVTKGTSITFYGSPNAASCRSDCERMTDCAGYTWVKPGGYKTGDPPMCYLMSLVDSLGIHSCCITAIRLGQGPGGATR